LKTIYVLDVNIFARIGLIYSSDNINFLKNNCLVTKTVIDVFKERLVKSIKIFLNNYNIIVNYLKSTAKTTRKRKTDPLRYIETRRRHYEDAFLYTVIRSLLAIPNLEHVSGTLSYRFVELLEPLMAHRVHPLYILERLYEFFISLDNYRSLDSFVLSVVHTFITFIEIMYGKNCLVAVGASFADVAAELKGMIVGEKIKFSRYDFEDLVLLYSICEVIGLHYGEELNVVFLTSDRKIVNNFKNFLGLFEDRCAFVRNFSVMYIKIRG